MASYVALLRGVNVGGKNKLPMKELTTIFLEAGCKNVKTYIQSGNVVFEAELALAARIPGEVEAAILRRLGYEARLTLRSAAELAAVIESNPFLDRGDSKALHVAFLATAPAPERIAALDPNRSPSDELAVRGREIYLFCPNGLGRSKLSNAWLDSKLETMSTFRNWNTVQKLLAMAEIDPEL